MAVPTSGGLDPSGDARGQVEQLGPTKQIANFISTANGETTNFALSKHAVPNIEGAQFADDETSVLLSLSSVEPRHY